MIDSWAAVVAHRGYGGVPANPEAPCRPGDGMARLADEAADPGPSPLGQHRPRRDVVDLLGPRAHRAAVRIRATPQPLGPHQDHWPVGDRQVPHHATALAPRPVLRRLHRQPPLAVSSSSSARTTDPSSPSSADTALPSRFIRGIALM
jgi:hypothetical protein